MGESEQPAPAKRSRKPLFIAALLTVLLLAGALAAWLFLVPEAEEPATPATAIEAPPDLEKFKETYLAGTEALVRGDASEAVARLASFSFGSRAVEEYRLYSLARAHQLAGNSLAARRTLARLWTRGALSVHRSDELSMVASLYEAGGHWERAANALGTLASKAGSPPVEGAAHMRLGEVSLYRADPAGILSSARAIVVESPKSLFAKDAEALLRSMHGVTPDSALPLTLNERVERARNLIRDGDPAAVLAELTAGDLASLPFGLGQEARLQRGIALHRLRRFDESNRVLEPLLAGNFRWAIPAIDHQARSYQALAASINSMQSKVVIERKKVGQRKVIVQPLKKKGATKAPPKRTVIRPRYANVKRTVQLVNKPLLAKKEGYERLWIERLKDLLALPISPELRRQTLTRLLSIAESKNQYTYLRELVAEIAKLDPGTEAGLQRVWGQAWGAYVRGDLEVAREQLTFIKDTYRNPNVRRQSEYWLARTVERQEGTAKARAAFNSLASAPYEDLYALFAQRRGGQRAQTARGNPLKSSAPDWPAIAEKEMPAELRLAYELSSLGSSHDARLEIRSNLSDANRRFANAILGELYYRESAYSLAFRSIRAAFPKLATVEQDEVPAHFLELYYPLVYEETIRKEARENELSPYLVMALIHQESAFNAKARSPVGATGLMQLMPATGRELGKLRGILDLRLENPDVNVDLGTSYLRKLIDLLGGSVELAVAGYNGGPYRIKKWREQDRRKPLDEFLEGLPLSETRNYVKRVTMLRSAYERLYGW